MLDRGLQSLARHTPAEISQLTQDYGQVVVDECHHVTAGSYEQVVSQIRAAWWLGLTATPERKDGLEQVALWQLGPIRHVMNDTLPQETSLVAPYDGRCAPCRSTRPRTAPRKAWI